MRRLINAMTANDIRAIRNVRDNAAGMGDPAGNDYSARHLVQAVRRTVAVVTSWKHQQQLLLPGMFRRLEHLGSGRPGSSLICPQPPAICLAATVQ